MLTYIIKWLAADPINNDLVELLDYAIWIASPPTTLYHFKRHQVDNHLTREKKTELSMRKEITCAMFQQFRSQLVCGTYL